MQIVNIKILGSKSVGKKTFVKKVGTSNLIKTNGGIFQVNLSTDYEKYDASIVLYDLTRPSTKIYKTENSYTLVCGNKCDKIVGDEDEDILYISAISGKNCFNAILRLLRLITGNENLKYV